MLCGGVDDGAMAAAAFYISYIAAFFSQCLGGPLLFGGGGGCFAKRIQRTNQGKDCVPVWPQHKLSPAITSNARAHVSVGLAGVGGL